MILGAKNSIYMAELTCENSMLRLQDILAVCQPIVIQQHKRHERLIKFAVLSFSFGFQLALFILGAF